MEPTPDPTPWPDRARNPDPCPRCKGAGQLPRRRCNDCSGSGEVTCEYDHRHICPNCDGKGHRRPGPCPDCAGLGIDIDPDRQPAHDLVRSIIGHRFAAVLCRHGATLYQTRAKNYEGKTPLRWVAPVVGDPTDLRAWGESMANPVIEGRLMPMTRGSD